MKIGVFGGTFDPIHKGHTDILSSAANSGFFDHIIVVLSANPPHKPQNTISLASYRYEMTRIALRNQNYPIPVILSDIEILRKEKSYTIDTIIELSRQYNDIDEFFLINGSDVFFELQKWHMPEELLARAGLFIFKRPDYDGAKLDELIENIKQKYSAKIILFDKSFNNISSSQLRNELSSGIADLGESIDHEVLAWIKENRIYDNGYNGYRNLDTATTDLMKDYEFILRQRLTEHRLIHSLNTMRECVKLAEIYKAPIDKCAIAGILHDCSKRSGARGFTTDTHQKTTDTHLNENDIPSEILHAYEGSRFAQSNFGIEDKAILDAIKYHTTSRSNASLIEKIVFVADKIEPARKFRRIDEIREVAYDNIDRCMLECLSDIIANLEQNGKKVHRDTIAAYNEYKKIKSIGLINQKGK